MKKGTEYALVTGAGGLAYAGLELLFRGFTHWSMVLLGGLCVLCLYGISGMPQRLWQKWVMGTAVILTLEFLAGILLNIVLGWNVWDYSEYRVQLYGQICLRFALCWLALCVPANALCSCVRTKLFHHPPSGQSPVQG